MKNLFLVITLICSSVFVFGQSPSKDDARRKRFEKTIEKLENKANVLTPENVHTVFVGSSSFTIWVGFEQDFDTEQVVNNGFGGSQLSDVIYYFDQLLTPFSPQQIVVYEGDNDISAGMTPEEYMDDVHTFLRMVEIKLPGTHVSFLPPKPSPSRKHLLDSYNEVRKQLLELSIEREKFDVIDITQVMYDLDGVIKKDIWKSDSLHMNRAGYELWAPIVQTYIRN
ncbi:GDSL-type esterase/lipase family protein [Membranihabitans marinus]|uniref:GDSL-type esterase/lipase family protein n=1 Tax=Membranihabitans marinus TaxID=1227546 RepID=UPI001F3AD01C|nr:GDSL-type esterase/lipase family protein [Membranihabitans marinus]